MNGIHIGQVAESASFFDSNTFATLIGVVIASLITYVGTRLSKRSANKMTAKMIIIRVGRMITNLNGIKISIDEDFAAQAPENQHEPWRFVKPSANETDKAYFTDLENALCLEIANFDVIGSLISLESIHNGYIDLMRVYSLRKAEIKPMLPANTILTGGFQMTEEERIALIPYTADMNSIIMIMRESLPSDIARILAVMENLKKLFSKKAHVRFPKPAKPEKQSGKA